MSELTDLPPPAVLEDKALALAACEAIFSQSDAQFDFRVGKVNTATIRLGECELRCAFGHEGTLVAAYAHRSEGEGLAAPEHPLAPQVELAARAPVAWMQFATGAWKLTSSNHFRHQEWRPVVELVTGDARAFSMWARDRWGVNVPRSVVSSLFLLEPVSRSVLSLAENPTDLGRRLEGMGFPVVEPVEVAPEPTEAPVDKDVFIGVLNPRGDMFLVWSVNGQITRSPRPVTFGEDIYDSRPELAGVIARRGFARGRRIFLDDTPIEADTQAMVREAEELKRARFLTVGSMGRLTLDFELQLFGGVIDGIKVSVAASGYEPSYPDSANLLAHVWPHRAELVRSAKEATSDGFLRASGLFRSYPGVRKFSSREEFLSALSLALVSVDDCSVVFGFATRGGLGLRAVWNHDLTLVRTRVI